MRSHHAAAVFAIFCAVSVFDSASARAGGRQHPATPEKPPAPQRHTYNLENCDLPTVFKVLANEARVELELDPSVQGTVNMRLEDIEDAKQVIDMLVLSQNLKLEVTNGVYHIKAADKTDQAQKGGEKPADGVEAFGQTLAKTINDVADSVTKPEMAAKFARYKHSYYLALMKEGFSANEALRIVIAAGDPGWPNDQKGK